MMKSKKRALTVVALVFLLACALSVVTLGTAFASSYDFEFSSELSAKYKYGETVEIPSATYGGAKADFVVNLPNGASTDKSTIKLDQTGVYTVTYLAKKPDSNEYAKKVITFSVYNQLFTVQGNGYTEYRKLDDRVGGLYANLEKGDVLIYNDVVDLTKFQSGEMLFKMGIIASAPGEADIEQFEVKLTDIYDESKYIIYRFKKFSDGGQYETVVSYYDCGFGTVYAGLEESSIGAFTYTVGGVTQKYKAHLNSEKYGAHSMISMTGGTQSEPFNGDRMFGITYDMNSGCTFVKSCNYGGTPYGTTIIADLNNESIFGERFEGFTDGKVKLSITPTKFVKNDCGFFFAEIGGIGVSESNWNRFETETVPSITVQTGEYSADNVPASRKGSVYKVFGAKAYDFLDGEIDCDVKVYYGYENYNKIRINVTNGEFKTDHVGEYTIEYSATNSSGNKAVVTLKVNCVEMNEEIALELTGEYGYGAVNAGSRVKLFESYEIKNYLGNPKLTVECSLNGGDVVYTLDENYSFVPYYAGTYTVKYVYGDFSTSKSIEKQLTVNKANAVYYEISGELPEYLVKNGKYDLSIVKAYSVASGVPEEVPVKIYAKNDGSSALSPISGDYVVSASGKVELVWKADVNFDVPEYTAERKVRDIGLGGMLDKASLFIPAGEGVSFVSTKSSVDCLFGETAENVGFSFVNVLARHSFKLTFSPYGDDFTPFGQFDMYLRDYENVNNFVKISFYGKDGAWYVTANDDKTLKVAESWGAAGDNVTIDYDISKGRITVAGNVFAVNSYLNGGNVTFNKGIVLNCEVKNVNGCKGISLHEINNQTLTDNKYDYIQPQIDTSRTDCSGEKDINSIITVGDYFAADVITPYAECTYSVKAPSGAFVVSEEGVTLENVNGSEVYTFKLTEYGNYYVTVTAADQNGNPATIPYRIIVVDYTPPVLTLTNIVTSGRVNSAINFAKYSVANDKGSHTAFITVLDPKGTMTYHGEQTNFTPTKKGVYTVTVSVIDKNGNIKEESYNVTVS